VSGLPAEVCVSEVHTLVSMKDDNSMESQPKYVQSSDSTGKYSFSLLNWCYKLDRPWFGNGQLQSWNISICVWLYKACSLFEQHSILRSGTKTGFEAFP
jgi:hypothetical protein